MKYFVKIVLTAVLIFSPFISLKAQDMNNPNDLPVEQQVNYRL